MLVRSFGFFSVISAGNSENTSVKKETFDECHEFLTLFRSSMTTLEFDEFPSRITKDFGLEFGFYEEQKLVTIDGVHPLYEYNGEGRENWLLFGEKVNELNGLSTEDNFAELALALEDMTFEKHLV